MLSENAKLNTDLFKEDAELVYMRDGFGEGLLEAAERDKNVVGLCADLSESTRMAVIRDKFPERFVEIGVAEQNLATVASGMAAMGKVPFMASYSMFSPGRNWEQVRTTICYNDRPVKVVGSHAGISVGPDGGTHQAVEDIAITRVLPRMVVVVPCDTEEARKATLAIAKNESPSYLRLVKNKVPNITTKDSPFELGKAEILWEGEEPQVAIIACGVLVHRALLAARELAESGIDSVVVNNHTVKPMDEETVVDVAKKCGSVVTVEDHQVAGGMGSAVAELLAKRAPMPIEFVGVDDKFGESGKPEELIEHFEMGTSHIVSAAKKAIKREN